MPKVRTCSDPNMIPTVRFDEYKDKYKKLFNLSRDEEGVVLAKWCNPEDNTQSAVWGQALHRAIHQLTTDVGQDVESEVFILGGEGRFWLNSLHSYEPETPETKPWLSYEHMFYDGTNICEGLINDLEIPTIGVINGPGMHTEMAVFCDITLIADDATIMDPHYIAGMVPGDGIQIAWQQAMGLKKANYAMMTGKALTPQEAVDVGLANEVVPKDKIYDRAMELAHNLLKMDRTERRATVQVLRRPWKKAIADELRLGFATEMWCYLAGGTNHEPVKEVDEKLGTDASAK